MEPALDPVTADGDARDLPPLRASLAPWAARPNDAVMLRLLREACAHCATPFGAVTLLVDGEERVVARVGPDPGPVAPLDSLCAHTLREPDALVVDDLARDPRFCDEPYVLGPPFVRLYAGVPVFDATGLPVGSLCVASPQPRPFDSRALHTLQRLARIVAAALETRALLGPRRDSAHLDDLLVTLLEPRVRDADPVGG